MQGTVEGRRQFSLSKNADTVLVDSAPVPTLMVPWNVPVSLGIGDSSDM